MRPASGCSTRCRRSFRATARRRPLVLVLDDLHAADEPSLLLLRFLAGELAASRLLVAGAYRDVDPALADPLASALVELGREPVTRRIALEGLSPHDTGSFIEATTSRRPTSELVEAVYAETEGNPLFVGEIVRLLEAEHRLEDDRPAIAVPSTLREMIARRMRRLPDEASRILTIASALGRARPTFARSRPPLGSTRTSCWQRSRGRSGNAS